jgi:hypothetical protein
VRKACRRGSASLKSLVPTSRPEVSLLLCCARTYIDLATATRIERLLQDSPDWDYLLRIASEHGVMPLLYRQLSATCSAAVPQASLDRLQSRFRAAWLRNLRLSGELLTLLDLFTTHGIPAIPFKGLVLATWVYGSTALRQPGDLDILVRQSDIVKARDLLLARGYRLLTPMREKGPSAKTDPHEYEFVHDMQQITVELRWRIMQPLFSSSIDLERLWERRVTVSLAGRTVPSLPPEELLVILCDHGTKHLWSRLIWVCDVAQLVRAHPNLGWRTVLEQARYHGIGRPLALGLLLASELLGAPLPQDVRRWAQGDRQTWSLATQVSKWLFAGADEANEEGRAKQLYYFRLTEHAYDRVRRGVYLVRYYTRPNERDRALLKLPSRLSFLYYLLRGMRLVSAYGLAPIARLLYGRKRAPSALVDGSIQ